MSTSLVFEQEWTSSRLSPSNLTVRLRIEDNTPGGDEMARIGEIVAAVERYLEGPTS